MSKSISCKDIRSIPAAIAVRTDQVNFLVFIWFKQFKALRFVQLLHLDMLYSFYATDVSVPETGKRIIIFTIAANIYYAYVGSILLILFHQFGKRYFMVSILCLQGRYKGE